MSGHWQARTSPKVALRKESVDRNIEKSSCCGAVRVALRKESVDRNKVTEAEFFSIGQVALRKESVDRNTLTACGLGVLCGRSPQGERG